ncbi:DUF488 domain-containing protein [Rubinisphaera margarita]|uniref:DUF488 domain-containing protein n=1 Tax=Rubinisphaera margarita TaxID=2909586 RepID=UPI001EE7A8B3|nr:DUF488 domain-containing protein [Rubinisphaera margarita]MCG6158236.1 DUF488 domain-containing protein [Rubinisphaera margarita]
MCARKSSASAEASSAAEHEKSIWTIGHSNREFNEFLGMLQGFSIETLVDVRRFPGSRRHPQFQQDSLIATLGDAGIEYSHWVGLGGRRNGRLPDSPNGAWRVESFNAYADYALSDEFQQTLSELESLATQRRCALMCSEAVPWRCHRRLIADALIARGWTVWDIFSATRAQEHQLPDFAVQQKDRVIYPAEATE